MQTLFTTKEAHEQLRVSMPTIRSWIHQGRLPVVRLGRRYLFTNQFWRKLSERGWTPSIKIHDPGLILRSLMNTSLDNSLITNARQFELRLYSDYWDQDLRRRKPINGIAQNTEEVLSMYGQSRTGAMFWLRITKGRAIDSIGLLMAVRGLSFPEAVKQLSDINKAV